MFYNKKESVMIIYVIVFVVLGAIFMVIDGDTSASPLARNGDHPILGCLGNILLCLGFLSLFLFIFGQ
jgi:hypothetical protein